MKPWTPEQLAEYMAEFNAKMAPQSTIIKSDIPDPGSESKLQSKILKWAKEHGFPCWHDRSRGKNQAGWPDVILIMPSKVVFIELKAAGGKLRKEQNQLKLQFEYLGHRIHICKSFKRFLEIAGGEI